MPAAISDEARAVVSALQRSVPLHAWMTESTARDAGHVLSASTAAADADRVAGAMS